MKRFWIVCILCLALCGCELHRYQSIVDDAFCDSIVEITYFESRNVRYTLSTEDDPQVFSDAVKVIALMEGDPSDEPYEGWTQFSIVTEDGTEHKMYSGTIGGSCAIALDDSNYTVRDGYGDNLSAYLRQNGRKITVE